MTVEMTPDVDYLLMASPYNINNTNNTILNSRERRDQLKREIELLGLELPLKFEKSSQLRILKAACCLLKKEAKFTAATNLATRELSTLAKNCFFNQSDLKDVRYRC